MPTTSQSLAIPTERGHDLAARLDLPPDGRPIACALFAHCFTCSKDLRAAGAIARALTAEGLAVLRIDFTGLGQSGGDFAEATFSTDVADLARAAAFLGEHFEPPSVLVGHSLGGAAVLRAAHRIDSARAVATIGAPCDPQHVQHLFVSALDEIERTGRAIVEIAGRRFPITKQFLDDLAGQRIEETVRQLRRALLIFHSPTDQSVGIENARHLFDAAKHPKSFVSLDTADHLLTDPADAAYVGTVLAAWARRYIGAPQETRKHPPLGDHRLAVRLGAEGFFTEIVADGHSLVADEPEEVGGTNRGPTPYDLVAAGLGACTAMTLRMYADRKGWPLDEVIVRLRHRRTHAEDCVACEDEEPKLDRLERELELSGNLDAQQRARLAEIAKRCPVHRTLERGVEVTTALREATD